jgi:hypothetical protein
MSDEVSQPGELPSAAARSAVDNVFTTITRCAAQPSVELFADALGLVQKAEDFAKWAKRSLKAAMLEFAKERGEFTIGTKRYYAGHETEVEHLNDADAAWELYQLELGMAGGDEQAAMKAVVTKYLSKDSVKHGAAEAVMDAPTWAKFFKRHRVEVLKDGKPKKSERVLIEVDTRYQREKGKGRGALPSHDNVAAGSE